MTANPFVLVPGYWLGGWAWEQVAPALTEAGHPVTALTLPGLASPDDDRSEITLAGHVAAVADAVRDAGPSTVLVAHSGAGKIVSGVLDASPGVVQRVIYVDSGPAADGLADDLPDDVVELPLPPWPEVQASLDGLEPDQLHRFRERAVPHPAAVAREPIHLGNPARRDVPSTLVCCSFPAGTVLELAQGRHPVFAEVGQLTDLTCVDLPTGHWPMWSRPADLAATLLTAAAEAR